MNLDPIKLQKLISIEPRQSVAYIADAIQKYDNVTLDTFPAMAPERKEAVRKIMATLPNPQEQQEWEAIKPLRADAGDGQTLTGQEQVRRLQALLQALDSYTANWQNAMPAGNHVSEAQAEAVTTQDKINQILDAQAAQTEDADWQRLSADYQTYCLTLDAGRMPALLAAVTDHLKTYPRTAHRAELDDMMWAVTDIELDANIYTYLHHYPAGKHAQKANAARDDMPYWLAAKTTPDINVVVNFLQSHPASPFADMARQRLEAMKSEELYKMRTTPESYSIQTLRNLLQGGIFTDSELISAGVATQGVLDTLRSIDPYRDLPDIGAAMENSGRECKDGYTDVYFFGIPSTGKTCVLMGLTLSPQISLNLASAGGDYASALQQYTAAGVTVGRTVGTFVTTLEAQVVSAHDPSVMHNVNLVEMSGEEFAFDIVHNPGKVFKFADMGTGAADLLANGNRKVFFIIIDPTVSVVHLNRTKKTYDEMTGAPIMGIEECMVNQTAVLQKLVNIFQLPENAQIMHNVDAIHFIVTKADTLGDTQDERDQAALELYLNRYDKFITGNLMRLCKQYNINHNTDFRPKLYTFSLGQFYIGGLYGYNPADSDRLVNAIRNYTAGNKTPGFLSGVKNVFNRS